VVLQFREQNFCPFFCPSQSRNLWKVGVAGGRRSGGRRMPPTAHQSGVRTSGADVRQAGPLRPIRRLHRIGDPMQPLGKRAWRPPPSRIPAYATPGCRKSRPRGACTGPCAHGRT
jgi:hypothetical protein